MSYTQAWLIELWRVGARVAAPGASASRSVATWRADFITGSLRAGNIQGEYKGNTRGLQGETLPLVIPLYSPCIPLVISKPGPGLRPAGGGRHGLAAGATG